LPPELEAIAEGRSDGDKVCLGADGKPMKVDHPSASKKIQEAIA